MTSQSSSDSKIVLAVIGLGLILLLALPAAASAATPEVATYPGEATGASTALVWGAVNPEGEATTWAVEWDLQSTDWCTSGGVSGSPANTTSATPLGQEGPNFIEVRLTLTGLTRSDTYCAQIVATNADGEAVSSPQTWVQNPPEIQGTNAFPSSATSATVEGQINPLGESNTRYWLAYAPTDSVNGWCSDGGIGNSGATSNTSNLEFSDSTFHDVSITLDGLTTGTEYCARLVALSDGGYEPGSALVTFTVDAPSAVIFNAVSTGSSTATITGGINAAGAATTYQFEYDLASSNWCTSSGASGSPAHTTDPRTFPFTDESVHNQVVDLSGLTAGQDYCVQLIATNANGTDTSAPVPWTEGTAPDALTFDTVSIAPTYGVVEGEVNGHNEDTTYAVQYDLASSEWCTSGGTSGSPAWAVGGTGVITGDDLVQVELTGLTGGTDYCAQIGANNPNGQSEGGQVWWTQGAPTADTYTVDPSGTTATIAGDVDPAGTAATYQIDYDLASSEWCQTGIGSPANSTQAESLAATDGNYFYDVSGGLSGLTPGENYCADVVAINAYGTYESYPVYWGQPPGLTVTVTGNGTVTSYPAGIECGVGGSACSYSFPGGTRVTLRAAAGTGSQFTQWTTAPGCAGTALCTVTVSGNTTVGAVFTPPPTHTLTVSPAGSGSGRVTSSPAGISCGSTCSTSFDAGTQITLTATPASGSIFAGWSGGGCSGTGACTVQLNGDTTLIPTFTASPPPKPACKVPKVSGRALKGARSAIARAHCTIGTITRAYSPRVRAGVVISQKPAPGSERPAGTKVKLTVSRGKKR